MSANKCFSYASCSRGRGDPNPSLLKFWMLCVAFVIGEFAGSLKSDSLKIKHLLWRNEKLITEFLELLFKCGVS